MGWVVSASVFPISELVKTVALFVRPVVYDSALRPGAGHWMGGWEGFSPLRAGRL